MSNCERCDGTGWIHGLGALGVGSMECTVCTTVRRLAVVTLATGEVLHVPIKEGPGLHIRAGEELRGIPKSMDVARARMLGEDDARREHAALWEAVWTTNEQERLAAAALQEQRSQEMIAAYSSNASAVERVLGEETGRGRRRGLAAWRPLA